MRNVLAVLLAAVAAFCGAGAWAGYTMDKALTQPETVRSTVGPLIHDDGVQDMIATRVREQIVSRLPGGVIQEKLKPAVDAAAKTATTAVLEDDDVEKAWLEVLDLTREGYTEQVRSGENSGGHIEMVLDPVADLASEHVTSALAKVGVKVEDKPDIEWRVSQELSDISPLVSLVTPILTLTVTQSAHWLVYSLVAAAGLLLGLLVASRRAIVFVTAGFLALALGLIGNGAASMVTSGTKGSSNAVIQAISEVFTDQVRAASVPLSLVGGALLVVGIVMMVVTGVRRRRAAAEDDFDWDEE